MESRAELRGASSSPWLMALFVILVTLALGLISVYVAKTVSAPASPQNQIISTEAGPTGTGTSQPVDPFEGCAPEFVPC
jgi:hypothetical protein